MRQVTVAIRLPYEDAPRILTVDEDKYQAGNYGITVTHAGQQVFYPWHRVDYTVKEAA